jgi:ribosomal protein S8E
MTALTSHQNAKKALILGIIEVFRAFRLNPTQAHSVIDEIRQLLENPSAEDVDNTEVVGKEVILRIVVEPNALIEVGSEVTTRVVPVIPKSVKL